MEIKGFRVDGREYRVNPALVFQYEFDRESSLYRIYGSGIYEDISAYGETLCDAKEMLEEDIIPFLWEEYMREDDSMLSARARRIKADLGGRVEA